jgi:sugar O-acyltransferase (sialic acid O-acetyltransferase NeuD family)
MLNNEKHNSYPIVIFGAGGHAVSVANVAISAGYKIAYFIDANKKADYLLGIKIIRDISELVNKKDYEYCIAIGDNALRERIYKELMSVNIDINFPSLIHKSAVISIFSTIGNGTVVMPNAIVGPNSTVGKFCIINTQSSIDHDCNMLDFSSIAPNAVTGGTVTIGYRSAISIGAVVKQGLKIGNDSVLGASSYLNKNLVNNKVAYGIPAKEVRDREVGDEYLK